MNWMNTAFLVWMSVVYQWLWIHKQSFQIWEKTHWLTHTKAEFYLTKFYMVLLHGIYWPHAICIYQPHGAGENMLFFVSLACGIKDRFMLVFFIDITGEMGIPTLQVWQDHPEPFCPGHQVTPTSNATESTRTCSSYVIMYSCPKTPLPTSQLAAHDWTLQREAWGWHLIPKLEKNINQFTIVFVSLTFQFLCLL